MGLGDFLHTFFFGNGGNSEPHEEPEDPEHEQLFDDSDEIEAPFEHGGRFIDTSKW